MDEAEIVQMTFSVCCLPEILIPWRHDVTTSPLYMDTSLKCENVHLDLAPAASAIIQSFPLTLL